MRNKYVFFLLLLGAFVTPASAQYTNKVQTALWKSDSVYKFDAKVRRYDIHFEKRELIQSSPSTVFLDSLAAYLQKHPELFIEIGVHSQFVYPDWDNHITKKRAHAVSAYLKSKGVPPDQLRAKGYGFTEPLYRERDLRVARTKKERDSLINLNNRVEFRVLTIDPKKERLFSTADTAFIPGSALRNYHLTIRSQSNALSLDAKDSLALDSMVIFLKQHPSFVLEVGSHADIRQYWKAAFMYTHRNSKAICEYMIAKGIAPGRLIPEGYGESRPLHEETEIKKMQSPEEQEKMYLENRRVEFKIISIQ